MVKLSPMRRPPAASSFTYSPASSAWAGPPSGVTLTASPVELNSKEISAPVRARGRLPIGTTEVVPSVPKPATPSSAMRSVPLPCSVISIEPPSSTGTTRSCTSAVITV